MSTVIFLGPTLSVEEARAELDAEYLPPVAQGDLYRAAVEKPRAIGIVDGYFDRVPSVWHKEILWALSQGIHVFGAASLGALRASELASFGMIGVGHVFKSFHDGVLEDDDEVAIVHAPKEEGYRPRSVAMVDIRATIARALGAGVLSEEASERLLQLAKNTPYPERSYRALIFQARAAGLQGLDAFERFLTRGRVEQKRRDAVSLLRVMKAFLAGDPPAHRPLFTFEHTDAFEDARQRVDSEMASPLNAQQDSNLLNELLLSGEWPRLRDGALLRALILQGPGARVLGTIDPVRAEEEFRIAQGLTDKQDFAAWRAQQDLDEQRLSRFFVEEAVVRTIGDAYRPELLAELPNFLRAAGRLQAVSARAREKEALSAASLADLGIDDDRLFGWYFDALEHAPRPQSLESYANKAGFADVAAFRRAVLSEYRLRRLPHAPSAQTAERPHSDAG